MKLTSPLEVAIADNNPALTGTNCMYAVRVYPVPIGPFVDPSSVPRRGLILSSPSTDVLVADSLAGFLPAHDFRRAIFDRLWPDVEIEESAFRIAGATVSVNGGPPIPVDDVEVEADGMLNLLAHVMATGQAQIVAQWAEVPLPPG